MAPFRRSTGRATGGIKALQSRGLVPCRNVPISWQKDDHLLSQRQAEARSSLHPSILCPIFLFQALSDDTTLTTYQADPCCPFTFLSGPLATFWKAEVSKVAHRFEKGSSPNTNLSTYISSSGCYDSPSQSRFLLPCLRELPITPLDYKLLFE